MFLSYLIFKWKIEANLNKQVIWIHEMSTKFTINRCLRVKRVIEFQFEYLKKKNKKRGKFASLSSSIWISFLFFNSLIPFSPILISLSSVSRLCFQLPDKKWPIFCITTPDHLRVALLSPPVNTLLGFLRDSMHCCSFFGIISDKQYV